VLIGEIAEFFDDFGLSDCDGSAQFQLLIFVTPEQRLSPRKEQDTAAQLRTGRESWYARCGRSRPVTPNPAVTHHMTYGSVPGK
ncbi:hypothetical protein BVRB_021130, partial [Beta vulgaris subsp. vulgaris]